MGADGDRLQEHNKVFGFILLLADATSAFLFMGVMSVCRDIPLAEPTLLTTRCNVGHRISTKAVAGTLAYIVIKI